jgi:hypothetical protein
VTTDPKGAQQELPAGLVIFGSDGRAQFGWQNPETGAFYAEEDGSIIADAIGAVPWHAGRVH